MDQVHVGLTSSILKKPSYSRRSSGRYASYPSPFPHLKHCLAAHAYKLLSLYGTNGAIPSFTMGFTMGFTIVVPGSVPRGIAGGMAYLLNIESNFPEKCCNWTVPGPRNLGRCFPMLAKSATSDTYKSSEQADDPPHVPTVIQLSLIHI